MQIPVTSLVAPLDKWCQDSGTQKSLEVEFLLVILHSTAHHPSLANGMSLTSVIWAFHLSVP